MGALTDGQLVGVFHASGTPAETIGVEVELVVVDPDDGRPASALRLGRLAAAGLGEVSFEAPGQIEVRTAPARSIRALVPDLVSAVKRAADLASDEQLLALPLGLQPFSSWLASLDDDPVAMSNEQLVLDLAAAVHVSISYRDERDAHRKVRAAHALTPMLVALFGGSPLARGRVMGASVRSAVWTSAFPEFRVHDDLLARSDGWFARYAAWAASCPADRAPSPRRTSFRAWNEGEAEPRPTIADWREHLRLPTADVRLKDVVEVRCLDSIPIPAAIAAAAMVRGLLCDAENADAIEAWTAPGARTRAITSAARHGLADPVLAARAGQLIERAAAGLRRLDDDPTALAWARAAVAAGRNWGQELAARWTAAKTPRGFLREVTAAAATA